MLTEMLSMVSVMIALSAAIVAVLAAPPQSPRC